MKIIRIAQNGLPEDPPEDPPEDKKNKKTIKDFGGLQFLDLVPEKEFGSGLPFVHFTILAGEYRDGKKRSTGVMEGMRENGFSQNLSAVEINSENIDGSLRTAFDNFAHHAIRVNRGLTWAHDEYEKPVRVIPGVVIIDNVGQINPIKAKDNEGHVWLSPTGPETVLAIEPLIDNYIEGNDQPSTQFRQKEKPKVITDFLNNQEAVNKLIEVYKRYI